VCRRVSLSVFVPDAACPPAGFTYIISCSPVESVSCFTLRKRKLFPLVSPSAVARVMPVSDCAMAWLRPLQATNAESMNECWRPAPARPARPGMVGARFSERHGPSRVRAYFGRRGYRYRWPRFANIYTGRTCRPVGCWRHVGTRPHFVVLRLCLHDLETVRRSPRVDIIEQSIEIRESFVPLHTFLGPTTAQRCASSPR